MKLNKTNFSDTSDIIINEIGRLYVADKNNCRLQIFNETRLRGRYQKLSALKSGTEFTFNKLISLNDKPVKLASAALASVTAVSTETGFIYIINDYNEIINFLKLKNFDLNDLKNILINESGTEFISVRRSESDGGLSLKFYKIDLNYQEETAKSEFIKKMSFVRKIKLESQYYPGICLTRFNCLKFSVDLKRILVFDIVNLNLIEFDYMSGKFLKVLIKAENNMANVLDIDFSGNQLHLVCIEAEANKRFSLCSESTSDLTIDARNRFKSRKTVIVMRLEKLNFELTFQIEKKKIYFRFMMHYKLKYDFRPWTKHKLYSLDGSNILNEFFNIFYFLIFGAGPNATRCTLVHGPKACLNLRCSIIELGNTFE
ncbi:hypothetical protein BpHYR1_013703 [Brachionus plicatilis]|uniref:Uncharacterized protein n=1 Tax=Brachionus plicatilis TaxID=10195 RepID=A0A3M7RMM4_BRAPC|nr:hypothetical protein BpHYR1_013703 [Brachionus plicatilis]